MIQEDSQIASLSDLLPAKIDFKNDVFNNTKQELIQYSPLIPDNSILNSNNEDKSHQKSNIYPKRKFFTPSEDNLLMNAVLKYKQESWNEIAQYVPGRTPKQCRDRWVNYLQPSLNFEPWKDSDDQLLVSLVNKYGTHWSKMKTYFPNRSTSSIKNRWYLLIKDQVKELPIEELIISYLGAFSKKKIPIKSTNYKDLFNIMDQNHFLHFNENISNYDLLDLSSKAQRKTSSQKYYFLVKETSPKNNSSNLISNEDLINLQKINNCFQDNHNIKHEENISNEEELISFTPEELEW